MLPKPRADLKPNTADFERLPLVKPTGFREYDARWLFPQEINLMGLNAIGLGLATLAGRRGVPKRFVVGHDYRSYSAGVKQALITGLLAGGAEVHDIGLALSPMAYFAQFELGVEGVAMVTASHNDNGWTGIKMGFHRPLTFGPDEMTALKEIVLNGEVETAPRRQLHLRARPGRALHQGAHRPAAGSKRKLKVVAACGNGTAGAFAPQVLEAIGCEVVPLDCELDYTFPRYNPNPEDMKMLHAISEAVLAHKADAGLGFDGDGDRCGVVDNEGHEIFADKVGVMLARDLSARHANAVFVADVKSTGLFVTDPVLIANKAPHALLEDRPLLHEALHARAEGAGRLREVRPLLLPAAARPRLRRRPGRGASPSATCSTAIRASRSPISRTRCPRPGARPPCRRTAPTRPSTASSTRSPRSTRTPPPRAARLPGRRSATSSPSTACA